MPRGKRTLKSKSTKPGTSKAKPKKGSVRLRQCPSCEMHPLSAKRPITKTPTTFSLECTACTQRPMEDYKHYYMCARCGVICPQCLMKAKYLKTTPAVDPSPSIALPRRRRYNLRSHTTAKKSAKTSRTSKTSKSTRTSAAKSRTKKRASKVKSKAKPKTGRRAAKRKSGAVTDDRTAAVSDSSESPSLEPPKKRSRRRAPRRGYSSLANLPPPATGRSSANASGTVVTGTGHGQFDDAGLDDFALFNSSRVMQKLDVVLQRVARVEAATKGVERRQRVLTEATVRFMDHMTESMRTFMEEIRRGDVMDDE